MVHLVWAPARWSDSKLSNILGFTLVTLPADFLRKTFWSVEKSAVMGRNQVSPWWIISILDPFCCFLTAKFRFCENGLCWAVLNAHVWVSEHQTWATHMSCFPSTALSTSIFLFETRSSWTWRSVICQGWMAKGTVGVLLSPSTYHHHGYRSILSCQAFFEFWISYLKSSCRS